MDETLEFRLFGLGGAGGKIADEIARSTDGRLSAVAIDTDFAAVSRLGSCQQIRIGQEQCGGLGSGGDTAMAALAARNARNAIDRSLEGVSVALVVAGLGGGTGSGLLPVLLESAASSNIPTIVFLVKPFQMEGTERLRMAGSALQSIGSMGGVRFVFSNDELVAGVTGITVDEAFRLATEKLAAGITLLWRLANRPGYLHLDTGTLLSIIRSGHGSARLFSVRKEGTDRLREAWRELSEGMSSPAGGSPDAKAALVGIMGGRDLRLHEVGELSHSVTASLPSDAVVELSTALDDSFAGSLAAVVMVFDHWDSVERNRALAEKGSAPHGDGSPAPLRDSRGQTMSGRFDQVQGTLIGGVNYDEPTYQRLGMKIDIS